MILTIDVGNSNIVIGGVEEDRIVFEARIRTDATKTSDEYCVDLKILLDVYGVDRQTIEGSIIASVVPQVLNSMQTGSPYSSLTRKSWRRMTVPQRLWSRVGAIQIPASKPFSRM